MEARKNNANKYIQNTIQDYILKNYRNNITLQETARVLNYSEVYFCRLFKQYFGHGFSKYITMLKIDEAKHLLTNQDVTISSVAIAVGYSNSDYFSKVFKRITGKLPSEYRRGQ